MHVTVVKQYTNTKVLIKIFLIIIKISEKEVNVSEVIFKVKLSK